MYPLNVATLVLGNLALENKVEGKGLRCCLVCLDPFYGANQPDLKQPRHAVLLEHDKRFHLGAPLSSQHLHLV